MAATIPAPVQQQSISCWSLSFGKRAVDVVAAMMGLILLAPFMAAIAAAILISSGRPILFRQWRLGREGQRFELYKFRTMFVTAPATGPGVTRSGDARITPVGRWLRRWKLDELPQLLNVVKGEMTLVGPRPDLERFWILASPRDKAVLALTPGITGAASLAFSNEEQILAAAPPERLIEFYVQEVLPQKANLDLEYAGRATFWSDCRLVVRTLFCPFVRNRSAESRGQ